MTVHVRLFATLRQHLPNAELGQATPIEIGDGATIADLYARLSIPRETVKNAFVRGIVRADDFVLQEGDDVGIFPPIAGGGG